MEVISNFFKKEPNLSFVTAKIQQNCTDTGNDNSEATRQRINCAYTYGMYGVRMYTYGIYTYGMYTYGMYTYGMMNFLTIFLTDFLTNFLTDFQRIFLTNF